MKNALQKETAEAEVARRIETGDAFVGGCSPVKASPPSANKKGPKRSLGSLSSASCHPGTRYHVPCASLLACLTNSHASRGHRASQQLQTSSHFHTPAFSEIGHQSIGSLEK